MGKSYLKNQTFEKVITPSLSTSSSMLQLITTPATASTTSTTTESNHSPPITATIPPQAPPRPSLIPELPDDVAVQCIARIPRSQHPTLSLVSRSWRFTLRSPHFFATRSLLHCTQYSLYFNIRNLNGFSWYHLDSTNPKKIVSNLPPIPSQPVGPAYAVLGPKIFVIGGSVNDIPSYNVWVFDCRINRWEMGPRMRVAREFAAAEMVGGKVYVMGGCLVDNWTRSLNWAEVFDPLVGFWSELPSSIDIKDKWMHASAVINDRIYAMADRGGVVYDVVGKEWGKVSKRLDLGWRGRAAVVDGVLYCYDYLGKIRGYDVERDVWKELKGVDKGLPKFLCGATMVNFDGKLCVVWEQKSGGKEMGIMCAEIEVRKDGDGGLSGSILWVDVILLVPNGSSIVQCLAVDL